MPEGWSRRRSRRDNSHPEVADSPPKGSDWTAWLPKLLFAVAAVITAVQGCGPG